MIADNYNPCCPNPQILIGPVGPQGPAGPQGLPGQNILQNYGEFINYSAATISANNQIIPLNTTVINNGFTLTNDAITVNNAGTYLITYSVTPTSGTQAIVGLYQNGTNIPNSNMEVNENQTTTNSYLVTLQAGAIITLGGVNTLTNNISLTANTSLPNANITLVKIA